MHITTLMKLNMVPYLISLFNGVDNMTNSSNKNKPKCCPTKDDSKEKKSILKRLWCFFFGCNCS